MQACACDVGRRLCVYIHCADMLNHVDWASDLSAIQGRKWLAIKKLNVVFSQPVVVSD